MKKKISIVDLAKSLNISPTTVSFILNGRAEEKRISADLVKRVLEKVEEVGYKPNQLARSLRTGKTNSIGLIVEDISNPFFANLARLIEEKASKNGYKIIYCSTGNNVSKTRELIRLLHDTHVDGYIIAPPSGIETDLNELINEGSPVVLFDRYLEGVNADYVGIDNEESTYGSVQHLYDQGFRNIAFITLASLQSQMQERLNGYRKAVKERNLLSHLKEIPFNMNAEEVVPEIIAFLKDKKELDAVIFGTNYLGISGLRAMKRLDLKIPEDLGVIIFDDHDLFELYSPSITTISQPINEISESVITLLLSKLNTSSQSQRKFSILPANLQVRESSVK